MTRKFEANDRYRPIVTIKKVKKDIPTVIEVSGRRYVHENADTNKRGKKEMKMSKGEFIQAMADHLYDTLGEDDSQDVILEMEDSKSFEALYDFFKNFIDDGFWTI